MIYTLLERGDRQIGDQELAGVVFLLQTFREKVLGQLVTCWQDNQGVLHSVVNGGGWAPGTNAIVGRIWLLVSQLEIDLRMGRVESRANIADGPTRGFHGWTTLLNALFLPPVIPEWLLQPWKRVTAPWDE